VIDSPATEQSEPIQKVEQMQRPPDMEPWPLQIEPAGASQLEPLHPGVQAQSPATSRPWLLQIAAVADGQLWPAPQGGLPAGAAPPGPGVWAAATNSDRLKARAVQTILMARPSGAMIAR
jgi:hypothetical protein